MNPESYGLMLALTAVALLLAALGAALLFEGERADSDPTSLVLTDGLLDPKAGPANLRKLIPTRLPSGRPVHNFQQ